MDFLCALFTRNNNRPDNFKHTGCGGCEANKSNEFPRKFDNFTQELGNLV